MKALVLVTPSFASNAEGRARIIETLATEHATIVHCARFHDDGAENPVTVMDWVRTGRYDTVIVFGARQHFACQLANKAADEELPVSVFLITGAAHAAKSIRKMLRKGRKDLVSVVTVPDEAPEERITAIFQERLFASAGPSNAAAG